jgi:hypothetical protein
VVSAVLVMAVAAGVMLAVIRAGVPVEHTSSTPGTELQTARPDRPSLSTTYDGPASCAAPGFLTGDTIGDANPVALFGTLCQPVTSGR